MCIVFKTCLRDFYSILRDLYSRLLVFKSQIFFSWEEEKVEKRFFSLDETGTWETRGRERTLRLNKVRNMVSDTGLERERKCKKKCVERVRSEEGRRRKVSENEIERSKSLVWKE